MSKPEENQSVEPVCGTPLLQPTTVDPNHEGEDGMGVRSMTVRPRWHCRPPSADCQFHFHERIFRPRDATGTRIVCDRRKLDTRGTRGAPDWVAEVLSPGTESHDQITKLAAYERAGVLEYWLIHPTDRTLTRSRTYCAIRASILARSASRSGGVRRYDWA
jgi:Putative restriction endonuclease